MLVSEVMDSIEDLVVETQGPLESEGGDLADLVVVEFF